MVFYRMFASGVIEAAFAAEDFVEEVFAGIVFTGKGSAGSGDTVVVSETVSSTVLVAIMGAVSDVSASSDKRST
ncbi:MAG: hypothetical protein AAGF54_00580 [Pseudomonadota bacterium]